MAEEKIERRKTVQKIKVKLSPAEEDNASRQIISLDQRIEGLREKKKSMTGQINEAISTLSAQKKNLIDLYLHGQEQEVNCEWFLYFKEGVKKLFYFDELVREEPLKPEDWQQDLPL